MSALAQPSDNIGQVAALQGQATVQRRGQAQPVPLSVGSPVYQDDIISTLAAAKVKLALIDGTELTLGEQGAFTLSKLVYSPTQNIHQAIIDIARGAFRIVTQKLLPRATFEVYTTTAVAAVRGTDWLGEVTADATAILVLRGQVAVVHAEAGVHGEAVLTDGMGTDVRGKQPPTAPKQWAEARIRALQQATALP
jgi:hypothetical protein